MTDVPTSEPRRHFMRSALAIGGALTGLPAMAEGASRVVLGLFPDNASLVFSAVLKALQGHYAPDLGTRVTYLPGNSGALAFEAIHRGPADGSHVLIAPSSYLTLVPLLRKSSTFDAVADFNPVVGLADLTIAFAVGPAVPKTVTSLTDYLAWIKENPAQSNYGVLGLGGLSHFTGLSLSRMAEVPLKAVAYKSLISMNDDLGFGDLPAAFITVTTAGELPPDGRVRVLAVASQERWPNLPQVPTMRELKVSEFAVALTYGLSVSSRTPQGKVEELREAVLQACKQPAVRTAIIQSHMRPMTSQADSYADALAQERLVWTDVLKRYRFSIDS